MQTYKCDVLVVGGGGAAIRAAIAAKEYDPSKEVMLITKGKLGTTGATANSCSDRMAFHATLPHTQPMGENAWKYHVEDIYCIGGRVSDYDLAEIHAKRSLEAFAYLDSLQVPFVKDEKGNARQFLTDGSKYARACYTGPKTAIHIEEALVQKIKTLDIHIVEYSMVIKLETQNNSIIGAWGVNETNEYMFFDTPSVILGTGGGGEVYSHHVFPSGATGDGYALALAAGASLVNMEFIQIALSSEVTKLACSGSFMRSVPRFINELGEEFLYKYFGDQDNWDDINNLVFQKGASWPISCEDDTSQIDIAVFKEMASGHKVYMDYSKNPRKFRFENLLHENIELYNKESQDKYSTEKRNISPLERLKEINPQSIAWLKEWNIYLESGDMIEIVPSAQHYQGGIKIRKNADTSVKGLFAVGECAGGQHGANRPGGNALLDCQVFGKIAGEQAIEYIKKNTAYSIDNEEVLKHVKNFQFGTGKKKIPVKEFRQRVQNIMSQYTSIMRTKEGLEEAWRQLKELKDEGIQQVCDSYIFYFETINILATARATVLTCMQRPESRGPHLYFNHVTDRKPVHGKKEYEKYYIVEEKDDTLKTYAEVPVRPEATS